MPGGRGRHTSFVIQEEASTCVRGTFRKPELESPPSHHPRVLAALDCPPPSLEFLVSSTHPAHQGPKLVLRLNGHSVALCTVSSLSFELQPLLFLLAHSYVFHRFCLAMGRYRSLMIRGLGLAVFLLVVYYPFLDWQPAERFLKSPGSTFSGAKWAFGLTDETSTEDAVLSLAPNISDISDVVPPTPMPPSAQPPPRTSMGKVTMLFGDRNAAYERAVMTHQYHADIQGYENYVLRAEMIDGIWNKPSYLLFLIMRELKRPPKERLQWLL